MIDEEGAEQEASIIHRDNDVIQVYMRNTESRLTDIDFAARHLARLNDIAAKCTYGNSKDGK